MFHNQMRPCELLHVNLRYKDDPMADLKLRTLLNADDLAALNLDPERFGEFAARLTGRGNMGVHNVSISGTDWLLSGYDVLLNKPIIALEPIAGSSSKATSTDTANASLPGMEPPPRQEYEVFLTFLVSIPIIGLWSGYGGMHKSIGGIIDVEFEESDRVTDEIAAEVEAQKITQLVIFNEDSQATIETRIDVIADFFAEFRNWGEAVSDAIKRWQDQQCANRASDTDPTVIDAEFADHGKPHATTLLDVPLDAITSEMLEAADIATLHRWYERLAGKPTAATSEPFVREMIQRRLTERQASAMIDTIGDDMEMEMADTGDGDDDEERGADVGDSLDSPVYVN